MFTVKKVKLLKINKLILMSIAAIFWSSCTNVYFSEPQPTNTASVRSFPKEIHGAYILEGDTIYIHKEGYQFPEEYAKAIPTNQLDTMRGIRIANQLIYDDSVPTEEGIPFKITNDTLYYKKTLYLEQPFSEAFIVKKEGDFMVVNQKEEGEEHWNVFLLKKRRNGNISLYAVGDFEEKIEKFFTITDFKELGKKSYLIAPTKREFKKLIKKGFFVKSGDLVKI